MAWILFCMVALLALIFAEWLLALLRRLFWLIVKLGLCALVALTTLIVVSAFDPDDSAVIAVLAVASGVAVFWSTRHWGKPRPTMSKMDVIDLCRRSVLSIEQRERLNDAEQALERAARDASGALADEWLKFWHRRVPELIRAAQDVYDDGDVAEKDSTVRELSCELDAIIAEADRRVALAKTARFDVFATRARHAQERMRWG